MSGRQKLTEMESTSAFIVGGGLTLLIIGFGLASAQSAVSGFDPSRLGVVLAVGGLLFVSGTVLWLAATQPWNNFDDWSKPLYTGHHDSHGEHATHTEGGASGEASGESSPVAHMAEGHVDTLEMIEGVGPKIAAALNNAGIHTFADLAARQPADLERIVRDSGVRMVGHTDSWIEQAQLAADGKLDDLKRLQDQLGRRA